ncbi:MAG: MBL fold metallo-hydrolase [Aerococcus sp.]|nr:MBL fold metallo-hydrolase [Aerococcus sp.]
MSQVVTVETDTIKENCYIISDHQDALIIDPGNDSEEIVKAISALQVTPHAILITHAHFDHIGALEVIRTTYQIPVYINQIEQAWLQDPDKNLSSSYRYAFTCQPAEHVLSPVVNFQIGSFQIEARPTPGHTPGSTSYVFASERLVFSGDALFKHAIGRFDFPEGSETALLNSIRKQLFTLPDDYVVYPGHGLPTTIGQERATNPFFR